VVVPGARHKRSSVKRMKNGRAVVGGMHREQLVRMVAVKGVEPRAASPRDPPPKPPPTPEIMVTGAKRMAAD
jgi:hypothetical protein